MSASNVYWGTLLGLTVMSAFLDDLRRQREVKQREQRLLNQQSNSSDKHQSLDPEHPEVTRPRTPHPPPINTWGSEPAEDDSSEQLDWIQEYNNKEKEILDFEQDTFSTVPRYESAEVMDSSNDWLLAMFDTNVVNEPKPLENDYGTDSQ